MCEIPKVSGIQITPLSGVLLDKLTVRESNRNVFFKK